MARAARPEADWVAVHDVAAALHLERELEPRDNNYIRISGLYQCKRQLAYRVRWYREGREELPHTSHALHIFDVGHALHYQLQMRLSKHGALGWVDADPVVKTDERTGRKRLGWEGNFEVSLVHDVHRIRGTLDCLTEPLLARTITTPEGTFETYEAVPPGTPNARRYIIDIKTCSARERWSEDRRTGAAVRKASSFEKLTEPKPEHVSQAMMYSWLVTQPGFKTDRIPGPLAEMPDVMILYVAKDVPPDYYSRLPELYQSQDRLLHGPYKVFRVPADMRRVEASLAKARAVWDALDSGKLPGRDYQHRPDWPAYPCLDCAFRKDCYQEEGYFKDDPDADHPRVRYGRMRLRNELDATDDRQSDGASDRELLQL